MLGLDGGCEAAQNQIELISGDEIWLRITITCRDSKWLQNLSAARMPGIKAFTDSA